MNTFRKINEVTPPTYRAGQNVLVMANGKMVPATVKGVTFDRINNRRNEPFAWTYWVSIAGVGVRRYENEMQAQDASQ